MQVKIGKIVNTHGVMGDLRIQSNSDFKEIRFLVRQKFNVKLKKSMIEVEIVKSYLHKNFIVVHLKGYDNINNVLLFKGCDIFAPVMKSEDLEPGEYLNTDLVGCNVTDQDKKDLGIVIEVVDNPAHNLLRIKLPNKKLSLIPFNDIYITDVNLDEKLIIIENIRGLIDED